MKILILTSYKKYDPKLDHEFQQESCYKLFDYLRNHGHEVLIARYSDIQIQLGKESLFIINDENILDFDLVIFRATTDSKNNIYNGEIAQVIAQHCFNNNKKMINGVHLTKFSHDFNKLFQMCYLKNSNVLIPETTYIGEPYLFDKLKLPLVRKPLQGSQGEQVSVIDDSNNLDSTDVIYQEILPDKTDYRVLVLLGKCLGAMKRTASNGNFVSNYSAGGLVERFDITAEMEELSMKCAELFSFDFCGVDIMKDKNGKLRVLEVNRFPGFNGFEEAMEVSVSEEFCRRIESL